MAFIKLLVLGILVNLSMNACNEGCLVCNTADVCTLCDVSSGYFLKENQCVKKTSLNCETITITGDCSVCKPGYYYDEATKTCLLVQATQAITDCVYYTSATVCNICRQGYYVSEGGCKKVVKLISNCLYYASNGTTTVCQACQAGTFFSADNLSCVQIPVITNCLSYTYLQCKTCNSSYYQNMNSYLDKDFGTVSNTFDVLLSTNNETVRNWTKPVICVKLTTVQNCKKYSKYQNACEQCDNGYYLSQGVCNKNPISVIPNCLNYANSTTCIECQSGYYLSPLLTCLQVTEIAFCSKYDGSRFGTYCLECNAGYYVYNNKCTERTYKTIAQCEVYEAQKDACKTCTTSYILTYEGRACLSQIANCTQYHYSSLSTTTLKCVECSDMYYIDAANNKCILGSGVDNCILYTGLKTCAKCANGYFVESSTSCKKHVTIDNCDTYEPFKLNTCSVCKTGYYDFAFQKVCKSIDTTDTFKNCKLQNATGSGCLICNDDYYLNTNLGCTAVGTDQKNCTIIDKNGYCTACDAGYLVLSNKCVLAFAYFTSNCAKFDLSNAQIATLDCQYCKQNYTPYYVMQKTSICVETTLLANYMNKSFTAISNCLRYNTMGECLECAATYYIDLTVASPTSVCKSTCDTATNTIVLDNLDGRVNLCVADAIMKTMTGMSVSVNSADYGCKYATRINMDDSKSDNVLAYSATDALGAGTQPTVTQYTCLQPKDSTTTDKYYKILLNAQMVAIKYPFRSPLPYKLTTSGLSSEVFAYNGFPLSSIKVLDAAIGTDTNCEIYAKFVDDEKLIINDAAGFKNTNAKSTQCLKCKQKYTLSYQCSVINCVGANSLTTKCVEITDCTTTEYSNLPTYLNMIASCHTCTTAGKYVVINQGAKYIPGNATDGIKLFTGFQGQIAAATDQLAIECKTITLPVTNCLIVSSDNQTPTYFCLACQPGYTPFAFDTALGNSYTDGTDIQYAITSCTAIENCETGSKLANGCSECKKSTQSPFYAYASINYNACVETLTDNCFVANKETKLCSICKPGYFLNYDGYCEILTLIGCEESAGGFTDYNLNETDSQSLTKLLVYAGLKQLKAKPYGCNKCSSSYTSVMGRNVFTCVASSYISSTLFSSQTNSAYDANCLNYYVEDALLKCKICADNYLPTNMGNCVANTFNTNCALLNVTDLQCVSCSSGYYLINGICHKQDILNCSAYENTVGYQNVQCKMCNTGYALTTGATACVEGSVASCQQYLQGSFNTCLSCSSGFATLTQTNGSSYCLQIPTETNCQQLLTNDSGALTKNFYCLKCATLTSTTVYGLSAFTDVTNYQTLAQNTCIKFPLLTNCASYKTVYSLSYNALTCLECDTGYYLNQTTNKCIERTYKDSTCKTFNKYAETCDVCASQSYKDLSTAKCVAYPTGVYKCAMYSSISTCAQCEDSYYLKQNTCHKTAKVIANCSVYGNNGECSKCDQGYFGYSPTLCIKATAQNCFTYKDMSNCATCDPENDNMGLFTDSSSVTHCVAKNITFCNKSTGKYPFKCLECLTGTTSYYPSETGACKQVTSSIANCAIYDSATTCQKCTSPFVLNVDKSACVTIADSDANCSDMQYLLTPKCVKCQYGYKFVGNACTLCSNASAGCLSCSASNTDTCSVCKPGYYMNSSQKCIKITQKSSTTSFTTSAIQYPLNVEANRLYNSSLLATVFSALFTLFAFLI